MRLRLALCLFLPRPPLITGNYPRFARFPRGYSSISGGFGDLGSMEHSGTPCRGVKFVDIGANLTDKSYQGVYHNSKKHGPDLDEVLSRARGVGVEKIIITAGSLKEVGRALDICRQHDRAGKFLFTTVGVHPTNCNEFLNNKFKLSEDNYLNELSALVSSNLDRVVSIGEIGLDYDRLQFCPKEVQLKYFEFQLALVERFKLPMFLHLRNASEDFLGLMRRNGGRWSNVGGVVHSYTGDLATMRELLSDGFYIGVNGCSLKTQENLKVVKEIPLDRLLLETDCPWCGVKSSHASSGYLRTRFPTVNKPNLMKGGSTYSGRNEPCHILNVAEIVHQLTAPEMDFAAFCDRVYENTTALFPKITTNQ